MRNHAALALIASTLLALLMVGCTAPPLVAPAATQRPPAQATTVDSSEQVSDGPTAAVAASQDAWDRVNSTGILLVGMSVDYPPFEYYDQSKVTGFDVELIQAIGKNLGLNVQIKDRAFDGLGDALQLGRIDLAISAISRTPERAAALALSDPYMDGVGSALAASNTNIGQVASARDLAGKVVAVQAGTVYEKWAQQNLVDAQLIRPDDLRAYQTMDRALNDLRSGNVQVMLLDAAPAKTFVDQGGVRMVAERLDEQVYVMAMKQDSKQLLANINKALLALQTDGTVAALAKKYSLIPSADISKPLPVPTSSTSPEPAPTVSCLNDVRWVDDLNLEDMGMTAPPVVAPGAPLQKGWRLINSGTCPWGPGYALTFANGDQMEGTRVPVVGQVAPGQQYDFKAELVAPTEPKIYQGWWQMRSPDGKAFGEKIYVGIRVRGVAGPTPTAGG